MIREKDLELSIGVMILFTMEPGRRVNRIQELMCGRMETNIQASGKAGKWKDKGL